MRPLHFALCVLLFAAVGNASYGQAARSELVGQVRDQNGSLVTTATITLTEIATGQKSVTSATDGNYTITNLRPGLYDIAVEASGFKQTVQEGVRLATGERVRLDVLLQPGAISETVLVSQDASLLRTESGSLGQVITNRKI